MKKELYFIALIPEDTIQREITDFKLFAAEHFDTVRALRSPPHVTLIPPFRWAEAEAMRKLHHALRRFAGKNTPFSVKLKGFGRFGTRVIFVHVELDDTLRQVQFGLRRYLASEAGLEHDNNRPYHPHMTIAFKDLRRRMFRRAWIHFAGLAYERTFLADRLYLLRHDGQQWQVDREFAFKK